MSGSKVVFLQFAHLEERVRDLSGVSYKDTSPTQEAPLS